MTRRNHDARREILLTVPPGSVCQMKCSLEEPPFAILHETRDIVAVDKPPGVVVIPARDEPAGGSHRHRLERARGERLWVVHRLDRDTSGVVVFARNAETHRELSLAFERHAVEKTYLALTRGTPTPPEGVIDVPLHSARRGKMRPALARERGSLAAETKYLVQRVWMTRVGPVALVEAKPRTGRQHQIRVHLRWKDAPLLVDPLYGRAERITAQDLGLSENIPACERHTLHAAELVLPARGGEPSLRLVAPLAPDLGRLVRALDALS